MRPGRQIALLTVVGWLSLCAQAKADLTLAGDVLPLLKARCVKCHGPTKREAKLDLSTPAGLARGGEDGAVIERGKPDESLLWQRVEADEMPPDDPLSAEEKAILKRWLASGAAGLPDKVASGSSADHWAFAHLTDPSPPLVRDAPRVRTSVDQFVLAQLEAKGLSFSREADRHTLVRRVSFDLTGLPPTPQEIARFVGDQSPDAYERMVERYLASPHYGERWGKYWLEAAGYADSNGYFNADTDRPLAYRYRDWVVRAINEDKPFDRFVLEQLAGDELACFGGSGPATPEIISLLEATHYLRNSQDGTGESDGNPDEVRDDRYHVLEGATQIVASSLLGLTMQCARCHDHKFEPITQRDYYQLQAVFYSVFNIDDWVKPNERFVYANLPGVAERWEEHSREVDRQIVAARAELGEWRQANRPPSVLLFHDEFDDAVPLARQWGNTAPGDDTPGGSPAIELDSAHAPAARRHNGTLQIIESAAAGDRWLSTKESFDWTPDEKEAWIQVTFDLVDDKLAADGMPAARVAYFIGLCDYNDSDPMSRGNVLVDGNPAGGASVHLDYPGADSRSAGDLGSGKYQRGHNYGVRITNIGKGKFRLEHLVDWIAEEKTLTLSGDDLSNGGFGFEYCCGRSFVVDNVRIERSVSGSEATDEARKLAEAFEAKQKQLAEAIKELERSRGERPGKISCALDRSHKAPDVFLLERGDHGARRERVEPAPLTALSDSTASLPIKPPAGGVKSTGRRLAWARWLIEKDSRQAALVARVQVNRAWQRHFGRGIVATTENLGASGAAPSHPELVDHLAGQFVRGGWSLKALHRLMLNSTTYRQSSELVPKAHEADPDNRLLWRHSLVRLDAESIRDAMLAVGGELDSTFGGRYVPTTRNDSGEVLVGDGVHGADRRSIYLQQRRTQMLSMLNVFDAPTLVFNCLERTASTMPLQSLCLLNSPFVITQSERFAERLARETGDEPQARIERAFLLAVGRAPTPYERQSALDFTSIQREYYGSDTDAGKKAWVDFCQMLLASNAFLYVE